MTTDRFRMASGLVALLLGSCGSPSNQASTVYVDKNQVPAELRDDYASFSVNCSKCHSLARAFNAHVTETAHWDLYVARMVRTPGSSISQEEVPGILRFLYWYTESYDRHTSFAKKTSDAAEATQQPSASTPTSAESAAPVDVSPSSAQSGAPPSADPMTAPETQTTVGEGK